MEYIVKLNARGTTMYVDRDILLKSDYFRCLLSDDRFKKAEPNDDNSYYVDCDSDVMVELIAYMETGCFKYKTINPRYLHMIACKFGVCVEKKLKVTDISVLFDAVIKYILPHTQKYNVITIEFLGCSPDGIKFVTMQPKRRLRVTQDNEITFGCYSGEHKVTKTTLTDNETKIHNSLKAHNLHDKLYIEVPTFFGTKGQIIFKTIVNTDDIDHSSDSELQND